MTAADQALLFRDEPGPVRVSREGGKSPFVLTADHAGKLIPRKLGDLGVAAADLERHIAWDIGIAGVTERLSAALDATAVLQTYSRLVIDCNRDPSWPSAIPLVSEFTEIPGNAALTGQRSRCARRRNIPSLSRSYRGLARRPTGRRTAKHFRRDA